MSKIDVVRAWKDPSYRRSLSSADQAALPAHPASALSLGDEDLKGPLQTGGTGTRSLCTPCPPAYCF